MSTTVTHPIGPTALAIKAALDDILSKAKAKRDVSFYLDGQGRLPFRNILPLLQSLALRQDTPSALVGGLGGWVAWNANRENTVQQRRLLISESVTEIADELRIGYCHTSSGDSHFDPNEIVGYLHLPNCVRIGSHAILPRGLYDPLYSTEDCVYMGTAIDSFTNLEEMGDEALAYVVPHIDLDFPKLHTLGARAFRFVSKHRESIRATWTFPAIQTIGAGAFLGLNGNGTNQDTVVTLRFPNLEASAVKAMENFPFGISSGSVIVCKNDEGTIVP